MTSKAPFEIDLAKKIPLIPLRDTLVYPHTTTRILVGRGLSVMAANKAIKNDGLIVLVLQKKEDKEEVDINDFYSTGVIARIKSIDSVPNGYFKVLLEGLFVVDIKSVSKKTFFEASISPQQLKKRRAATEKKEVQSILEEFGRYAEAIEVQDDFLEVLSQMQKPLGVYYSILSVLKIPLEEKQTFLEIGSYKEFAEKIRLHLLTIKTAEELSKRIKHEVQEKMHKTQKEWVISEQIRLLQEELGDSDGLNTSEYVILSQKIKEKNFSPAILEKLEEELSRMKTIQPASPEYSVIRNYIDWFLALPWNQFCKTQLSLNKVKKQLDQNHYGLDKVKDRILEHLAVLKLTQSEKRTPILCLVGPPGVGKTTLVSSIAQAMERQFVRITLGGVRDEAEIRGHRRTYIGAMPGRLIQSLKRAKCMNPVILLDEIDKMASDFRGDPASAMLEVLDPELNQDFTDHFMEVGIDLSKVLFIATANAENTIPEALHDRLEMIRLPGYYEHEKEKIAKQHLIPQICEQSGVQLKKDIQFSKQNILQIIKEYTREAGVRQLERAIANIVRQRAKEIVTHKAPEAALTNEQISSYLGVSRYSSNRLPSVSRPGVITGLAWTSVGGEILMIECMLFSGKGNILLTGKLGDVMKESAQIALSLVRVRLEQFGIDPAAVKKTDIHIHLPEGAVPKDGPSAGIALTLALLSAFTKQVIDPKIAFTGEVSLTGVLHAIGGLNEKALAALSAGVKTVFLPQDNQKDVAELPSIAQKGLKIHLKTHIDEIIDILFKKSKTKKLSNQNNSVS